MPRKGIGIWPARCALVLCLFWASARAAELQPETVQAFDHYIRLTEARVAGEVGSDKAFLWMDGLPADRRELVHKQLRQGQVVIERLKTLDAGKEIKVPDGLIHHWMGVVFIPGTTIAKTMALVQDYDQHQDYYKPDVIGSKLREHNGNDFKIYLRFIKKKVLTVVMNTEHDVRYFPLSSSRVHSRSYTTRIAEVENYGEPEEREKPVGNDHGLLWRLYSYWRFEERDGGVYVQCEAVSLTRSIPAIVSWLVKPFVTSVPRESLQNTLSNTRAGLVR